METSKDESVQAGQIESPATSYSGPVVVDTYQVGGHTIRLVRPTDPDRLLDDPAVIAWNRRDDYMPYWAYVWPGAYLLAEAVVREPWPVAGAGESPPEALEIGCGVGLAGLAAMAVGLRVQFTDYDEASLDFVKRSVDANGFDPARCILRRLDWRELPDAKFPIIIGSDVIYEARLVALVANLLSKLLASGGVALIATPYRRSAESFPAALASAGLDCRREAVTTRAEDGQVVRGILYRVTWADE